MNTYKALKSNIFQDQNFKIVPLRPEDRYIIMEWRNEQIEHLRQREPLTKSEQDLYFNKVVKNELQKIKPQQILFSFLKDNSFVGYGGLVHIDHFNKNAEISFLTNKNLKLKIFNIYWKKFVGLLKTVAFDELSLIKIYAYAYDVRPFLYDTFREIGLKKEARIRNVYIFNNKIYDAFVFSMFNFSFNFRNVSDQDLTLTFGWAKDKTIRKFSKNNDTISIDEHTAWFKKILSKESEIYLIASTSSIVVGSLRFSISDKGTTISFLLDNQFQKLNLSKEFLRQGINFLFKNYGSKDLIAEVHVDNIASVNVFNYLGFTSQKTIKGFNQFKLNYEDWKF